jgi:hypothetical protein
MQELVEMVVMVVSQLHPAWLLVEMEEVQQMAWLVHQELTIPRQRLNLIFKVGVEVEGAELQGSAEEWAERVVLEGLMVEVVEVEELVETQLQLGLVVLVVLVEKV